MRKIMTILYYASSADARKDCEILSIDKRRVTTLRKDFEYRARLKVSDELLRSVDIEKLHHVDSESFC